VEASRYGPRLSALVGLLGSAFPLSFSKTQALLDQLLGVEYSCGEDFVYSRGAIATIPERISATLEQPVQEVLAFAGQQPVAYVWMKPAPPPAMP
jgi:hypothetical protein